MSPTKTQRSSQSRGMILLSHAHVDNSLAKIVAKIIERVSLGQVTVWYSSDSSATGGFRPGDRWLETLREKLQSSKAVVTLVTPRSVNRPWIHFESGFGAAKAKLEVIPVCIGHDSQSLPPPLGIYEAYQLSDLNALNLFLGKLLARFGIKFDEEMAKPVIEPAVGEIVRAAANLTHTLEVASEPTLSEAVAEIKAHFDRRTTGFSESESERRQAVYSVPLTIELPGLKLQEFFPVSPSETVADKMHAIHFKISSHVEPFTYLEKWILRDTVAEANLVIREMASRVPAQAVFRPGSKWTLLPLEKPYTATDSHQALLRGIDT